MIEAMKQALEALDYIDTNYMSLPKVGNEAIKSLRQAIAEAEKQEPVGYMGWGGDVEWYGERPYAETYLYTHPQPKREPLTDEVIKLRGEIGVLVGLLGTALQVIDTVDGEDAAECEMLMELQNKITYAIQGAST